MKRNLLITFYATIGLFLYYPSMGQQHFGDSSRQEPQHVIVKKMIIHSSSQKGDTNMTHCCPSINQGNIDSLLKVLMPEFEISQSDSNFHCVMSHPHFVNHTPEMDSMMVQIDREMLQSLEKMGVTIQHSSSMDSLIETFDLQLDPLNFEHSEFMPLLPAEFEHQQDSLHHQSMHINIGDSCKKIIMIKDDGTNLTLEQNGDIVYINKIKDIADADSQVEYQTNENGQKVIIVKTRIVLQDVTSEEAEQLGKQGIKTSNKEPEFDYLRFYPNPSQNIINIEFKVTKPSDTKVIISDMLGKKLYEEKLDHFEGNYAKQVDLSEFGSGTYILQINQGKKSVTRKIMIN